jgi:DNA repair protein RecN (Recombination protein N)
VRKSGAAKFSKDVEGQLADLAMGSTVFEVAFAEIEAGPKGIDQVEFVISPNPGEPVKPLAKIASGGELSRLMLALKTVMAGSDRVPTLIFDEIDTGIGGRTAQVLGEKLSAVGKTAQVLCVTHLPQIASRADVQFSVQKLVEGSRTVVRLDRVEGEARIEELARMLGGAEDSRAAMEHAREMLGSRD